MHLPDGVLDPRICFLTSAAATGAVGYCAWKLARSPRQGILARPVHFALVGAGIFAAQAFNFPLGDSSGHVLGGAIAGVLLGPWAGVLVVSLVLAVQCLAFGDGGITALGANILNMAVLGPWLGHLAHSLSARSADKRTQAVAIGAASLLSVVLGAASCGLMLAASGEMNAARAMALLIPPHLVVSLADAAFTLPVLSLVIAAMRHGVAAPRAWGITAVLFAVLVASAIGPAIASTLPDGLETALAAERLIELDAVAPAAPIALAIGGILGAIGVYLSTWLATVKLATVKLATVKLTTVKLTEG
jgi:cobalt/nickel transport system permease protein